MLEEKIKVGFVGCGGISRLYTSIYAGLAEIAQVVAVADIDDAAAERRRGLLTETYRWVARNARLMAAEARSQETAAQHRRMAAAAEDAASVAIRKYRSHEALLEDAEVQAIVLLTPPSARREPVVAATESGRHIFTQGPMARSVEDADAIVAAVEKTGVKFHSQCSARYPRGMALARRAVESGMLGMMGSARVELNWYRPQTYYRGWHGTWEGEGGGAAFHHGRYIIDPFLWVVGSPVVEVFAYSGPALREIEHESLSQAVVRFANGATGTFHASLLNHRQPLTPEGRIEILGRNASLLVGERYNSSPVEGLAAENYWQADTTFGSSDNPSAVEALDSLRNTVSDVPERASEAYQTRLFLESIANDTQPLVPIEVPRHHVEVVRAIYKSAAEHRPVTLPLDEGDPFYSFEGRLTHGVKRRE